MRSRLAASIERARIAMTKLENIFNDKSGPGSNPGANNTSHNSNLVAKQLLDVYKNCKCLDSFMNTTFFDESHFGDLLSKVKERSKLTMQQQAVKDHMERLFEGNFIEFSKAVDGFNLYILEKLCIFVQMNVCPA